MKVVSFSTMEGCVYCPAGQCDCDVSSHTYIFSMCRFQSCHYDLQPHYQPLPSFCRSSTVAEELWKLGESLGVILCSFFGASVLLRFWKARHPTFSAIVQTTLVSWTLSGSPLLWWWDPAITAGSPTPSRTHTQLHFLWWCSSSAWACSRCSVCIAAAGPRMDGTLMWLASFWELPPKNTHKSETRFKSSCICQHGLLAYNKYSIWRHEITCTIHLLF